MNFISEEKLKNAKSVKTPRGELARITSGEKVVWQKLRLPPEYQKVPYIESTGTQYIDTGYAFKDDFSWEIDFEGIATGTTVFGGRKSETRTAILYQYVEKNVTTCPIGSSHGGLTPFQLGDLSSGRHTVKMAVASNKGSVWVDGVQKYNNTAFAGAYVSGTTQAIFADNFGGGNIQEYTSSKVYELKMWQGTNLVRNFIPCYRKSDGKVGIYDLVTEAFFTNAGTGEFVCEKPKYKCEVEYLESTGTQYINTGVYGSNTLTVEATALATQQNSSYFVFGARSRQNGDTYACLVHSSKRVGYRVGTGSFLYSGGYDATDEKHTYKIDNGVLYRDGVVVNSTCQGVSISTNCPVALLTINTNNTLDTEQTFRGYLYRCQLWDDGTLVRDYIPVLDWNDRPCVYDKVTDELFYNQGTGEFLYGLKEAA